MVILSKGNINVATISPPRWVYDIRVRDTCVATYGIPASFQFVLRQQVSSVCAASLLWEEVLNCVVVTVAHNSNSGGGGDWWLTHNSINEHRNKKWASLSQVNKTYLSLYCYYPNTHTHTHVHTVVRWLVWCLRWWSVSSRSSLDRWAAH